MVGSGEPAACGSHPQLTRTDGKLTFYSCRTTPSLHTELLGMVRPLILGASLMLPGRPASVPARPVITGSSCALTLPGPAGSLPVGTRVARIRRSKGEPGELIVQ